MNRTASTLEELDRPTDDSRAGNPAAREARAWLVSRLCWERRLKELRARTEPAFDAPAATSA